MSKAPAPPPPIGGSKNRSGQLLLVGFVLYVVAWFVPVYSGQEALGALRTFAQGLGASQQTFQGLDAPEWLPGWEACQFAWNLLVDSDSKLASDDQWKERLCGGSCLTNVVMVLALVLLTARHRLLTGLLLLACAGVNASWIYLLDRNPFEVYRVGYFLWLLSFGLTGFGALGAALRRR